METAAAFVSLLTIVETAAKVGKASYHIYQLLRDAPSELASIKHQLTFIQLELDQIQRLRVSENTVIPQDVLESILTALSIAEDSIEALRAACVQIPRSGSRFSSARWAILKRSTIRTLEERLKTTQIHLCTFLQLIALQNQCHQSSALERIETLVVSLDKLRTRTSTHKISDSVTLMEKESSKEPYSSRSVVEKKSRVTVSSTLGPWFWFLGMKGTLLKSTTMDCTRRSVSIRLRSLPVFKYRNHILLASFTVKTFSSRALEPSGGIFLATLVPEEAEIMRACAVGDLNKVKDLFDAGVAHPLDVTPENRTPLFHAIESGNLQLVSLLAQNKALVNMCFGNHNTSPLQSALYDRDMQIVRLLIRRGAHEDHLSSFGWSALSYLWAHDDCDSARENLVTNSEFLRLFKASSFCFDLSICDTWGWTILERVVAEAAPEDIEAVLDLSIVNTATSENQLLMATIKEATEYAIQLGNYEAFSVLLNAYGNVEEPFGNCWTLLETAAYYGHDKITRHLLKLEAEEFSLGDPYFPDLAQGRLENSGCDNCDEPHVAWDFEKYSLYLDALLDYGRIVKLTDSTSGGDTEEIYWDVH